MSEINTVSRKTAIVGLGETKYYKHGGSPVPEFQLVLEAITKAADDAGIDVRDIDGFSSYASERSDPTRLAAALGTRDLSLSSLVWIGGGGGGSAAVANAAAALVAGYSKYVVVYRSLAQGQFYRFGKADTSPKAPWPRSYLTPYGLTSPAQLLAMRVRRFMYENNVGQGPMKAISLASYHHAQQNPNAVMYGRPLTSEDYDASRWIAEPFHLFDCCMENDGAAAVILTTMDRAKDLRQKPAVVLAAAQGSSPRQAASAHNATDYATSNFKTVAARLYAQAGVSASDVDVCQAYENFTGGVMMSLVEHGFCEPGECEEFMTLENFTAPSGKLPLNTSGGNLAECYMHGLELVLEAARQVRGQSHNQVPDVEVSLVCSGPMVPNVSDLLLTV